MARAAYLYYLTTVGIFHRLRHDFGREIVVGVCGVVILGLFFYVFNDFLNTEVKSLSEPMRRVFGTWLAIALWLTVAMFAGRTIRHVLGDLRSYLQMAKVLGEDPAVLRQYRRLLVGGIALLGVVPAVYVSERFLVKLDLVFLGGAVVGMVIVMSASFLLHSNGGGPAKEQETELGPKRDLPSKSVLVEVSAKPKDALRAMVDWRYRLMTRRNRLTRLLLFFSLVFLLLTTYVATTASPTFVGILSAFMSGVFVMAALAYQLGDDLEYSWVERNLGVSHELYLQAQNGLAMRFGLALGPAAGLLWFAVKLVMGAAADPVFLAVESAQVAMMVLGPILLFPPIAFQIDARRPALQIMVGFLIGLFICTAIFAHILATALIPLVAYYGNGAQNGYFYRI